MTGSAPTQDLAALWNGSAGQAWVDNQDLLDGMFAPVERMLADAAADRGAKSLLDIGCGTGATTLAVARRLGAGARCMGVDISAPMIAVAQERARREKLSADFVAADAQAYGFAPASFDMLISRFGVMFFDDFAAAFANLRRAAQEAAELRFVVWRSAEENPFMTAAERAAAPLLPQLARRDPDAPGQFALADRGCACRFLEQSGWAGVAAEAGDFPCQFPASELERYFTRLGPVGTALLDADAATHDSVIEKLHTAFAPFVVNNEVCFTAACWVLSAHAG